MLTNRAQAQHLLGSQWGMMNETGSYPGQVWLWLYTFWYQIKPFSTSANADILVMAVMGVLSLAFILVPVLPGDQRSAAPRSDLQVDLARSLPPSAVGDAAARAAGPGGGRRRERPGRCTRLTRSPVNPGSDMTRRG